MSTDETTTTPFRSGHSVWERYHEYKQLLRALIDARGLAARLMWDAADELKAAEEYEQLWRTLADATGRVRRLMWYELEAAGEIVRGERYASVAAFEVVKTFGGILISTDPVVFCNPESCGRLSDEMSDRIKRRCLDEYSYWRQHYSDNDYTDWDLLELYYDGHNEIYALIEKDGQIRNVQIMSDG